MKPRTLLSRAVSGVWLTLLLQSTFARGEGTESGVERVPELVQFNKSQCLDAIKAVQESNKYTEDSIASHCADKMEFARCDFFAETLSLASKHSDFDPLHFCHDMEAAHFCSTTMDKLLTSIPVADLAYGECTRAKPPREVAAYCNKFRAMLSTAVQNEDLDTMRACYMIEAYANDTGADAPNAPNTSKESKDPGNSSSKMQRIIASNGTELSNLGSGEAAQHMSSKEIVLKPKVFSGFGNGTGSGSSAVVAPTAVPIIVPPIPANPDQTRFHASGAVAVHSLLTPVAVAHQTAQKPSAPTKAQLPQRVHSLVSVRTTVQSPVPSNFQRAVLRGKGAVASVATETKRPRGNHSRQPLKEEQGGAIHGKVNNSQKVIHAHDTGDTLLRNATKSAAPAKAQRTGNMSSAAPPVQANGHNKSTENATTGRARSIVTHVVPLSPLAGRPKAGLTQARHGKVTVAGTSKEAGTRKAGVDSRKKSKGDYNGFLSKFVQ